MDEDNRSRATARLRVLVLTDTAILGAGGSERFLRNLLEHLPAAQCEVDVLQLAAPPTDADSIGAQDAAHLRLVYRPIRAIYGRAGIAAFVHVRRLVRTGRYDIVQSQHEKSDLINALLPRGPGELRRLSSRRDMGFQKSSRLRWLMRRLDSRFDRIAAPSQAILAALARNENVDPARLRCIVNGVDTQRFAPVGTAERDRLRAALGSEPDEVLIGCVASFSPVKRHVDLIEAFARVHAQCQQARLLLIGDGGLRTAIESRIATLALGDAVRLLGARGDVAHILPALDLFVLASGSEGMSNAILEAQACALPVVATRVGGNPELVREDCGVLVEAGYPTALAGAMLELTGNVQRRMQMGAAARSRVLREHSLANMADSYLALYRELIDGR